MATWTDVTAAAPEIAALAKDRIEATGLALLATLRRDGYPRLSGVEPSFSAGEVWLGMMPRSLKALDLLRDPRMSLHNATVDKDVKEGDVKITGRATAVSDRVTLEQFREATKAKSGFDPGSDFHLFTVDVLEVSTLRPAPDQSYLIIDAWRVGGEPRRIERR
jgi:hypothetical protein